MKHFTLAVVLLAVFVSVALADRPSLKKKPVKPVPESVEEEEVVEQAVPKKPLRPSLKKTPVPQAELSEEVKSVSQEELSEEEQPKQSLKKPVRPAVNKKPVDDDELIPETVNEEEPAAEQSEEVKEKTPEKKTLLKKANKKPLVAADLGIEAPENLEKSKEPLEVEPPSVISKPKVQRPALLKN